MESLFRAMISRISLNLNVLDKDNVPRVMSLGKRFRRSSITATRS